MDLPKAISQVSNRTRTWTYKNVLLSTFWWDLGQLESFTAHVPHGGKWDDHWLALVVGLAPQGSLSIYLTLCFRKAGTMIKVKLKKVKESTQKQAPRKGVEHRPARKPSMLRCISAWATSLPERGPLWTVGTGKGLAFFSLGFMFI